MKIQNKQNKTTVESFAPGSKKVAIALATSAIAFLGLNASAKAANWYDFTPTNPLSVGVSVFNPAGVGTASGVGATGNWTILESSIDYDSGSKSLNSILQGSTAGNYTSLSGNVSILGIGVKPVDKTEVLAILEAPSAQLPFSLTYDYRTSTTLGKSSSFFEISFFDFETSTSSVLTFHNGSLAVPGSFSAMGSLWTPAMTMGDQIHFYTYLELDPSLTGTHALNANAQMNIAIPEPSSYAAALGFAALGIVGMKRIRDRKKVQAIEA